MIASHSHLPPLVLLLILWLLAFALLIGSLAVFWGSTAGGYLNGAEVFQGGSIPPSFACHGAVSKVTAVTVYVFWAAWA